ncbi:MAG: PDDEXK nuclease domain-containing protein, partial [Phycisphaerales bacterium]
RRLAEAWDKPLILQQVVAQLPWGHNVRLLDKVNNPVHREWYARACIEHGWSRSILEMQIETGFLERTFAATSNFDRTLPPEQSDLARQTIRDPFCFDFLAMTGRVKEKDLESGLVSHIRDFLLELGTGFAFVGAQYPLKVSNREYRLDLLFYHLRLRCYLIVELKAREFRPEDSGKMSFYLAAADDLLRHPSDNRTIGMILCRDKDRIVAEYALRESTSPLGVAQFSLHRQLAAELADKLPSVERIEECLREAELSDAAGVSPPPSRDPPSRPVSRGDPPQS